MKQRKWRVLLSMVLAFCLCLSAVVPVSAAGVGGTDDGSGFGGRNWLSDMFGGWFGGKDEDQTQDDSLTTYAGNTDSFYRIVHIDCGRKYFTVDDLKKIIDYAAAYNYTHVELAFGNDGLRFLLDDMSLKVDDNTSFDHKTVYDAIKAGNKVFYDAGTNELTETEMDYLITYANDKHIGIIPMFDAPGHLQAVIRAMITLGVLSDGKGYSTPTTSGTSVNWALDPTNANGVNFVKVLMQKYITYFAGKGCTMFNIAADECGFSSMNTTTYTAYVEIVNSLAAMVKSAGMTTLAFNDGIYHKNLKTNTAIDTDIAVCYWDASADKYASAATLASKGFKIINTNNHWYYVIGKENITGSDWGQYAYTCEYAKRQMSTTNSCLNIDGDNKKTTPVGCMAAIWCDYPSYEPNWTNIESYIKTLKDYNTDYFVATPTPAVLAISGPSTISMSQTDGVELTSNIAAQWSSDDEEVIKLVDIVATRATNDSYTTSVLAKPMSAGTTTIRATSEDGQTATASFEVKAVGEATEEKSITVTVGGTKTEFVEGTSYSGSYPTDPVGIATAVATPKAGQSISYNATASAEKNSYGSNYSIDNVLDGKSDTFYWSNDVQEKDDYISVTFSKAIPFDAIRIISPNSSNDYCINAAVEISSDGSTWISIGSYTGKGGNSQTYDVSAGFGYVKAIRVRITSGRSNWWQLSEIQWGNYDINSNFTRLPASGTITTASGSEIVFTGVAVGTTYVTIGNTRYTVNVVDEDLTNVTPLPIQTWITNNAVETGNQTTGSYWGAGWNVESQDQTYARYVNVSAQIAHGEDGVAITQILPDEQIRYEFGGTYWERARDTKAPKKLVIWSGRVHDSSNIQIIYGTDYSNSGTEFKYVRYYGGSWAVSNDRINWTTVTGENSTSSSSACTQQIAVYYMIRSEITDEVTTDVADWGYFNTDGQYSSQIAKGSYIMLDFSVKYEDGTRNPSEFPKNGKTFVFQCEEKGNAVIGTGNTRYRQLNNFRAVNTSDYEVYMVTVTMTEDSAASAISNTTSYKYNGEEQIVWAIDEATKTNSGLADYVSISGSTSEYSGCKIGGDPYVRGVEVYNKHGALITYYVRAKAPNLHVYYHVQGSAESFYDYGITGLANSQEGLFNEGFGLDGNGILINNTVKNILGKTQTVLSELKDLPAVPAQYRYSTYRCIDTSRSSDGTEVHLYYTISSKVTYVVDFGLPVKITPSEVNAYLGTATITNVVVKNEKGEVSTEFTHDDKGNVIYTPSSVIDNEVNVWITYYGTNVVGGEGKEGEVTYNVKILPASNVYYEESFFNTDGKWSNTNPNAVSNGQQKTETLNNKVNNYGYDEAYATDANKEFSNRNALVAEVTVDMPSTARPTATFTFEGTGFDIVSECSNNTGMLFVRVMDANDNNRVVKQYLVDTYLKGDGETLKNGSMTYQIPVVRCTDVLPYGTYNVRVQGTLFAESGAVPKGTAVANTLGMDEYYDDVASKIYAMLEEFGVTDEDMDTLEFVYMDENSVLNGGTGVATYSADSNVGLFSTNLIDTYAENRQYCVYLDGFRVYNPLKFAGNVSTEVNGLTSDRYDTDESSLRYVPVYKLVSDTNSDEVNLVYIETDPATKASTVRDWKNYRINGPYNEIYLAPGQSIVLKFDGLNKDSIQISAKSVDGKPVVTNFTEEGKTISTCTEMYYTLKVDAGNYVTISNRGTSGVLSISEVKLPDGVATLAMDDNDKAVALELVNALYAAPVDPEPEEPETFEPEYLYAYTLPVTFRRVGATITVTSSTESGIEVYIRAGENGKVEKLDPTNTRMVRWGIADKYIYSFNTGRLSRGEYTYYVYAVMNGVMSEPIPVSFVVW